MREKSIVLSVQSVRAILDGRKTQTRRVVKGVQEDLDGFKPGPRIIVPPAPYSVGDVIWVKEPWGQGADRAGEGRFFVQSVDEDRVVKTQGNSGIVCLGGENQDKIGYLNKWRSARTMPRFLCQFQLEVTEVRTQRVQEISGGDAGNEGIRWFQDDRRLGFHWDDEWKFGDLLPTRRAAFGVFWDSINSKKQGCDWASNPWVWAITFRRMRE